MRYEDDNTFSLGKDLKESRKYLEIQGRTVNKTAGNIIRNSR
jgi:hypothetical protein